MDAWLAIMNQWAAAGLAVFLNTLWYAAAVVALVWAGLRAWRGVNAATRHWIWAAVLVFLLALPFLPALLVGGRAAALAAPVAGAMPAVRAAAPVVLTVDASASGTNYWPLAVLAMWLAVMGWQLGGLFRGLLAARGLKARAQALPLPSLPMPMRRRVRLLQSAEIDSLLAVGFTHPAVIAPPEARMSRNNAGGSAEGSDEERRGLLLHELAHLARYDDWTLLGTRVIAAVLALHPLARFVRRRIDQDREMACDDCVGARIGAAQGGAYNDAARRYARSLARMHDRRHAAAAPLLAAGIASPRSALGERIASLVSQGRKFSARPSLARLALGGAALALLLALGGFLPGWIAFAQIAMPKAFAAAEIRPGSGGVRQQIMMRTMPGGRFSATNVPLPMLIEFAYDIREAQLENLPAWAKSRDYSIDAVPPPGMPNLPRWELTTAVRQMLRSLLADRFGLQVEQKTKQLPVYDLVVAKGGAKLKRATAAEFADLPSNGPNAEFGPGAPPPGPVAATGAASAPGAPPGNALLTAPAPGKASPGRMMMMPGRLQAAAAPISTLTGVLAQDLGRVVIDQTGLTGNYDFTLTWTPTVGESGGMGLGPTPPPNGQPVLLNGQPVTFNPNGPSIFTALREQLGLQLKPAKGPVPVVIVRHIAPPTPN